MNKRIFISGITGFIGSILAEKLLQENYEIYGLCRSVTDRKLSLPKDINVVWGDIIDSHYLKKVLKQINPEIIVHLASPSSVYYSHEHPQENMEVTIMGTINLQKACENLSNLEKFIFASTSETYGNQDKLPIGENAPLKPNQPYAIAKVAAENYLNYCKEAIGFPSLIMKPFNTYGRIKNFTFVTESIIYQMLTKDEVYLGNPNPIRDLLYIDDHVEGYLKAIKIPYEKLENAPAINLCTGVGTSIKELAELISKLTHFKGEIFWNKTNIRSTEIDKLIGDGTLACNSLDWKPKYSLREGLLLTIEKIKKVLEK